MSKKFSYERTIHFFDCDPAGIIFYSRIFDFSHEAYESFFKNLFPEKNYFDDDLLVFPIVHAESNYLNALKHNDKILIELNVENISASSFTLIYKIFKAEIECANAKTVHVCVDKTVWKKKSLPQNIKELLKEYLH
ncbi:MAG: hypothetical protein C0425_05480 [Chlorobiaceae bacterium]|nr:hypothetical protein [Chlorobiaceae bacterium]MBA4309769.1 hypothetical protein [Chlorobiaceae bacterium]